MAMRRATLFQQMYGINFIGSIGSAIPESDIRPKGTRMLRTDVVAAFGPGSDWTDPTDTRYKYFIDKYGRYWQQAASIYLDFKYNNAQEFNEYKGSIVAVQTVPVTDSLELNAIVTYLDLYTFGIIRYMKLGSNQVVQDRLGRVWLQIEFNGQNYQMIAKNITYLREHYPEVTPFPYPKTNFALNTILPDAQILINIDGDFNILDGPYGTHWNTNNNTISWIQDTSGHVWKGIADNAIQLTFNTKADYNNYQTAHPPVTPPVTPPTTPPVAPVTPPVTTPPATPPTPPASVTPPPVTPTTLPGSVTVVLTKEQSDKIEFQTKVILGAGVITLGIILFKLI